MYNNLILETVDAEITSIKTTQRARGAESRVRNCLANGPLRVQSNGISQSILQRVGIRQLPGKMKKSYLQSVICRFFLIFAAAYLCSVTDDRSCIERGAFYA